MHPEIARARRALDAGRAAEARATLDALDATALPREDVVERALLLARACLAGSPRDPGAALAATDQGLAASAGDPRLNASRAVALLEAGRLEEAEKAISRAVALGPELADSHFTRGVIRERRGSLEKAYRSFTRALMIDKAHLGARSRRASVARRVGRLAEARTDLETYLATVPRDAREWIALGVVRSELGSHDDALAALRKALEIDPTDLLGRFQAVVAAGRKHDLDLMGKLTEDLARAASFGPESHQSATDGRDRHVDWARGLHAIERGALAEACDLLGRTFRRALIEGETTPEPEAAVVAERLFPILKKASKETEARIYFEEALRKGSHSARFLRAWARSFGRPAARGLRVKLVVRSRGQGDPPERLARVYEVEAETMDEAWDLAFESERTLGGQGLERGVIIEDEKISKEDGPILASLLAIYPRAPEEDGAEAETPEPQGFEPEKGWTPDEEGQNGEEGAGGEDGS